jgi:hypothetical protein
MSLTRTEKIGAVILTGLLIALIIAEGPAGLGALACALAFIIVTRLSRGFGPR